MRLVGVISLGCAKNLVDTETMLGILKESGYSLTSNFEEAEVIIINTCGFIKQAKEESVDAILGAVNYKKSGSVKKIIVTGCLSQRYRRELEKEFPEIDAFLGVNEYPQINRVVEGNSVLWSEKYFLYNHLHPRVLTTPPSWVYLKISEGCSHQCSFCAIPFIRGPYRSREIDSIIIEAQNLASQGIKELNLISQDTTFYGQDLDLKDGLTQLLKKLIEIEGIEWIRILYSYPEEITDSLLEILNEEKICSYLDIPFQHSDEKIIKKMVRGTDGKRALKLIRKIRKKVPDITLRTSLIVGFPGEGEREFENLKNFCRKAEFDRLGVFTYSQEEGTPAFLLGDPVSEKIKERRKKEIMELQAEISYEKNKRLIGQRFEAIIEGHSEQNPQYLVGRLKSQAPEVDGVVLIENNNSQYQFLKEIDINEAFVYDLKGKIIK
ncbi:MAG: 30S ribosomal protein S12 methylthiotransferase RimO [Candidatus Aminicenantia bacterium]